jgi:hypothetical protein
MLIQIDHDSYLIFLRHPLIRSDFELKIGIVPGSYASRIVNDILDRILEESVDIKKEYTQYYIIEYGSFSRFLDKKYHFSKRIVRCSDRLYVMYSSIIYCEMPYSFLSEDDGAQIFSNLLKLKLSRYED